MKRRIFTILIVLCLAAGTMTACTENGTASVNGGDPAAAVAGYDANVQRQNAEGGVAEGGIAEGGAVENVNAGSEAGNANIGYENGEAVNADALDEQNAGGGFDALRPEDLYGDAGGTSNEQNIIPAGSEGQISEPMPVPGQQPGGIAAAARAVTEQTTANPVGVYENKKNVEGTYKGESFKLNMTASSAEGSAAESLLTAFSDRVSQLSDGKITIDLKMASGSTAADPLDAVTKGDIDIAWGSQVSYENKFPKSEVLTLPLLDISSATQATEAFWDLFNTTKYLEDEYKDWHVLLLHCGSETPIVISQQSRKQPEKISDLSGLRCIVRNRVQDALAKELKMTSSMVSVSDKKELKASKTDTALFEWADMASGSAAEEASLIYDENIGTNIYFLLMNKQKYEGLPEEARQILDEAAYETIKSVSVWDDAQAASRVSASEKILKFEEKERDKLEAAAEKVTNNWILNTSRGEDILKKTKELLALHR